MSATHLLSLFPIRCRHLRLRPKRCLILFALQVQASSPSLQALQSVPLANTPSLPRIPSLPSLNVRPQYTPWSSDRAHFPTCLIRLVNYNNVQLKPVSPRKLSHNHPVAAVPLAKCKLMAFTAVFVHGPTALRSKSPIGSFSSVPIISITFKSCI